MLFMFLVLCAQPLLADNWPAKIRAAMQQLSHQTKNLPKAARAAEGVAHELVSPPLQEAHIAHAQARHPAFVHINQLADAQMGWDLSHIRKGKARVSSSRLQNTLDQTLHSSFRAKGHFMLVVNNVFTGTLFKTTYNGQEEIYGVVATHALAEAARGLLASLVNAAALHRVFDLEAYDKNGNAIPLKGEVVQLGAYGTIDISLVRILPQTLGEVEWSAAEMFEPFELNREPVAVGDVLHGQGFHKRFTVYDDERYVVEITPFSLRTTLAGSIGERFGMCGGPACADDKLFGIHTGGKEINSRADIGYVTPASYLELLVQAYHNGGEAFYPLKLSGFTIAQLRVDEYPTKITLFDSSGEILAEKRILDKFSYKKTERMLRNFRPRYVEFTLGQVRWSEKKPGSVEFVPNVRRVKYDLMAGQPVPPQEDPLRDVDWQKIMQE